MYKIINYSIYIFVEEKDTNESTNSSDVSDSVGNNECSGIWKVPRHCSPENFTCEYSAQWEVIPREDAIRFTITTKHTDTWTGIGFSDDEKMVTVFNSYLAHFNYN